MGPGVLRLCSISIAPGGGIFENVCKSAPQEGQVRSYCRRHSRSHSRSPSPRTYEHLRKVEDLSWLCRWCRQAYEMLEEAQKI